MWKFDQDFLCVYYTIVYMLIAWLCIMYPPLYESPSNSDHLFQYKYYIEVMFMDFNFLHAVSWYHMTLLVCITIYYYFKGYTWKLLEKDIELLSLTSFVWKNDFRVQNETQFYKDFLIFSSWKYFLSTVLILSGGA